MFNYQAPIQNIIYLFSMENPFLPLKYTPIFFTGLLLESTAVAQRLSLTRMHWSLVQSSTGQTDVDPAR